MRCARLFGALLATLLASACDSSLPRQPRLVVLYATCSLNRKFLEPYNPAASYTPALARFARESLVFRRHQTESGQSGTAYASLFSGTQATNHRIFRHPAKLRDEVFLITEAFAPAGYDVHTWLTHLMASAELGYGQGVPAENVHAELLEARDAAFQGILDRLVAEPEYRAFVVANFTVTHGPYQGVLLEELCARHPDECARLGAPENFERYRILYEENDLRLSFDFEETIRALALDDSDIARLIDVTEILYKADVFRLDRLFGEVVEAIEARGLEDESLLAFTSDHGEIHYRENADFRWTHGFQLAPEVLNVALLLRGRGAGVVPGDYGGVTRSIDVFPTLAGLSGVPLPLIEGLGENLAPAVRRETEPPRLAAYSHTAIFPDAVSKYARVAALFPRAGPFWMGVSVREGDRVYKWRHEGSGRWKTSVFDLVSDPGEVHDLYDANDPGQAGRFLALAAYRTELIAVHRARGAPPVPPHQEQELLRGLGYIE
jgi:arylsulfatase A-like enzyme